MTRKVSKEWIINIWKKKNQKYYRTYNNKPDWKKMVITNYEDIISQFI